MDGSRLCCFPAFVLLGGSGFDVELMIFTFLLGGVITLTITDVVLSGSVDVVLRIIQELIPVGKPPSHSGDSKEHWIHISGESHGPID